MRIISTAQSVNDLTHALGRASGLGGVLVPTMGALHTGHKALIEHGRDLARSRRLAAGCIVSIFVNPTQFTDPADLARYPRTLDDDLAICEQAGASVVFVPDVETMYPPPPSEPVVAPPLPAVATEPGLEDAHRPGHFAGVCQVVLRLFRLIEPDAAVFGEKDWQQLQVIRAMVAEQRLPIDIVSHPTLRDTDGLAMSSRNRFLSPAERRAALAIPKALRDAQGKSSVADAEAAMHRVLADAGLSVDYAVVRDAASLGPVTRGAPARLLIAARSGVTRLIDNTPLPEPT